MMIISEEKIILLRLQKNHQKYRGFICEWVRTQLTDFPELENLEVISDVDYSELTTLEGVIGDFTLLCPIFFNRLNLAIAEEVLRGRRNDNQ